MKTETSILLDDNSVARVREDDDIVWPNVLRNYAVLVPVGHDDDAICFQAYDSLPINAPINHLYDRSAHLWGKILKRIKETQRVQPA